MPFEANNLKCVASSGVGSAWFYASDADTIAQVTTSGYFDRMTTKLRQNDVVLIRATDGGGARRVTSATGAVPVTVGALS